MGIKNPSPYQPGELYAVVTRPLGAVHGQSTPADAMSNSAKDKDVVCELSFTLIEQRITAMDGFSTGFGVDNDMTPPEPFLSIAELEGRVLDNFVRTWQRRVMRAAKPSRGEIYTTNFSTMDLLFFDVNYKGTEVEMAWHLMQVQPLVYHGLSSSYNQSSDLSLRRRSVQQRARESKIQQTERGEIVTLGLQLQFDSFHYDSEQIALAQKYFDKLKTDDPS